MTGSTHPLRQISRSSRRSRRADRLATIVLWAIAVLALALLGAIILYLVIASIGVVSPALPVRRPERHGAGRHLPAVLELAVCPWPDHAHLDPDRHPGGHLHGRDFAGDNRLTNSIRFAEEAISSVPSIVVGLFGLIAFVNLTGWGYTALSGAMALTLFNLPLLARLTEQALRAVPDEERAGSLALGATKWQTTRHVVLPLAHPGHHHRHHPDGRPGLRRGRGAPVHRRRVHPDALRFSPTST